MDMQQINNNIFFFPPDSKENTAKEKEWLGKEQLSSACGIPGM